jgi:hypothetical protein
MIGARLDEHAHDATHQPKRFGQQAQRAGDGADGDEQAGRAR